MSWLDSEFINQFTLAVYSEKGVGFSFNHSEPYSLSDVIFLDLNNKDAEKLRDFLIKCYPTKEKSHENEKANT